MNYQHFYHAGSHADVFKHLILMALLNHFLKKTKPLCYIDTHAGFSEYNLSHSHDWQEGLGKLQNAQIKHPLIQKYLDLQKQIFLGSPKIAKNLIRPEDEIILIEKSEEAYQYLKQSFRYDKQTHIHLGDAYQILLGLLPPKIKRGLILIDPPYEDINELDQLIYLLKSAIKKFPTACYAIWHPIKSRALINKFYKKFPFDALILEFCPYPDDITIRLNGSGMIIINPPYEFEKTIAPVMAELKGVYDAALSSIFTNDTL